MNPIRESTKFRKKNRSTGSYNLQTHSEFEFQQKCSEFEFRQRFISQKSGLRMISTFGDIFCIQYS